MVGCTDDGAEVRGDGWQCSVGMLLVYEDDAVLVDKPVCDLAD